MSESEAISALREIEKVSLRAMEINTNEPDTDPQELLTALFLTITDMTRSVLKKYDSVMDAEIIH